MDGSAGIFTGLYWVATGKAPLEDLEDDQDSDQTLPDQDMRVNNLQDRPSSNAWSGGRGFGK